MRNSLSRFHTAAFYAFVALLAGCGGGGSGSAPVLPARNVTIPVSGGGPVSYMQSSGPLTTNGTIAQGATKALIAVMSGVAQPGNGFASDTLMVSTTGASPSSAVRTRGARPALAPAHPRAPEAFAVDDSALFDRLAASAAGSDPNAKAVPSRKSTVPSGATVGTQTHIWVQQGGYASRTNLQVPATLLVQSPHGNIWVQSTLVGALTPYAAQLSADFENGYSSDTAHFASPDYPQSAPGMQPQYKSCSSSGSQQGAAPAYIAEPSDRRINVMVVDSSTLGGIGGYFSSVNLMTQGALNCLNAGYESNEAPFIFVGWFGSYGAQYELQEDMVRSDAHELQHLINFVNHGLLAPGASNASFNGNESQYINEGLSMLAQDLAISQMYGAQGIQFDAADALPRAQAYLANPAAFSLSSFSGVDSASWGGGGSARTNCSGGCYGAAYLFQRYLRDRFGGDVFTHAMETSGVTGTSNLQSVSGENAGNLVADFALAMAANTVGAPSTDARFSFGSLDLNGS